MSATARNASRSAKRPNATVEHHGDSFTFLKHAETGSADVIITDPPYSKHVHANLCSGSLVGKKQVPKYELTFDALTSYEWLHDAIRVAKRWVVVFCALEDFGRFEMAVGRPAFVRSCVQYRPNAMGQLTADRPATAYDGIALFHGSRPKKRWNGKGSFAIWKCNGTRGKKGRHPNEKHINIAFKLVSLFSERGETILDPFCGSGVFGEAAVRLGRKYVGLDNDKKWVKRARQRILAPHNTVTDKEALALCTMKEPALKAKKQ